VFAAENGACRACHLTIGSIQRSTEEFPGAFAATLDGKREGDSICHHASTHLAKACQSLVGLVGEDVLLESLVSGDSAVACDSVCEAGLDSDLLFVLDSQGGSLKKDTEDNNLTATVAVTNNNNNINSPLQTNNGADENRRLRDALAQSQASTNTQIAAAVKNATDLASANAQKAQQIASQQAVAAAQEKWRNAWRSRQWPVNVKVPKVASKLACTTDSEGRIAFRNNDFFGCKNHCVNVCEQCNCKQEETSVWDQEGKVFKRVKREVCDQCCNQKCAPEWLNFSKCARVCKACDCKTENGIKVCQQCCNEECRPSWNPNPI